MTTEQIRTTLIARLDRNHQKLLEILKNPKWDNPTAPQVLELYNERACTIEEIFTLSRIQNSASK